MQTWFSLLSQILLNKKGITQMLAECLVSALAEQVHTDPCLICLSILPWENKQSVRLKINLCNREACNAWALEDYRALILILANACSALVWRIYRYLETHPWIRNGRNLGQIGIELVWFDCMGCVVKSMFWQSRLQEQCLGCAQFGQATLISFQEKKQHDI